MYDASVVIDSETNNTRANLNIIDKSGLNIIQGNEPIFITNGVISCGSSYSSDKEYDEEVAVGNNKVKLISNLAGFVLSFVDGPGPIADFTIGLIASESINLIGGAIINVNTDTNGDEGVQTLTTYTLENGCVLDKVGQHITVYCNTHNISSPSATINYTITDGNTSQSFSKTN